MERSALAGVDMNLVLALEALVVEENVGRAARRVGLSASAMSHALARLRDLLKDPILVRAGQQMTPTKRARELAVPLTEGLALVASALARSPEIDVTRERRVLRVAASDFALNYLVPDLVARMAREAPLVQVIVTTFGVNVFKELSAGHIDMAIGSTRVTKGFRARPIMDEPFLSVARRGHPALATKMTVRRFAALDHVLISPRGRRAGAVDEALRKKGLKRRVALVVPTFLGAVLAVRGTDMVLTCGERSAHQAAPLVDLTVFAPPLRVASGTLRIHWHERQEHDPFLRWARDIIERVARESSPRSHGHAVRA